MFYNKHIFDKINKATSIIHKYELITANTYKIKIIVLR